MLPGGLMDVPAKEIPRLLAFDEFADRVASEMLALGRAIERRIFGWSVANQDQPIESGEPSQALPQFLFAVLARRVERSGIRIAESSDV